MPKHIILFSDGTGNSSAKLFKTNVWRVYQAVDLADPQHPDQPRQFAFYDNGVGTSSFKPLAVLGGALGVGLSRNVRDLYMFLCRLWQPGDLVYAFGFSRGAFTIRVLVGLAMSQGLVRYDGNEADLERFAAAAYRAYRRERFKSSNPLVEPLRDLRDAWVRACDRILHRSSYGGIERLAVPQPTATSGKPLEIAFLGLWDTVDAYGLPVDELTRAIDRFVWPLTMRDYDLSPRVRRARHALSLDDERNAFRPRLWNEPAPNLVDGVVLGTDRATRRLRDERIGQVWFAGVHSNVGGGYPDDALSYVPLEWIMREARDAGLRFEPSIWTDLLALSDENGPANDSRHGLAGYYRYNPRRIEALLRNDGIEVPQTKIHESVLRRIKVGQDGYAPIALPPGFAVVRIDGEICDGNTYVASLARSGRAADADADAGGTAAGVSPARPSGPLLDTVGPQSPYAVQREHVYNWVWWRRVAWFATFGVTMLLLAMPLFAPGAADGACPASRLCFTSGPIRLIGLVLPQFAATWIDAFASHPAVFWPLALAVAVGLGLGSALERKIGDEMRRVWYAIAPLRPNRSAPIPPPQPPGALQRGVERLRSNARYRAAFRLLALHLLPAGFLVALACAATAGIAQLAFSVRASLGDVCHGSAMTRSVETQLGSKPFATRDVCAATGIRLEQGATYRILITIPAAAPWTDNGLSAGPSGIDAREVPWTMAAAVPLRRHLTEAWYQPMARIGSRGSDTYALHPRPAPAAAPALAAPAGRRPRWLHTCAEQAPASSQMRVAEQVFATEIVARTEGELFLYVNDAIFLPGATDLFYCNNEGRATVGVSRVLPTR